MRRKKQILLPVRCLDCVARRSGNSTEDCVYSLSKYLSTAEGVAALRDAAAESDPTLRQRPVRLVLDSQRPFRPLPESGNWCPECTLQYKLRCVYDVMDRDTCLDAARLNSRCGISRFFFVTSGKALRGRALDEVPPGCRRQK